MEDVAYLHFKWPLEDWKQIVCITFFFLSNPQQHMTLQLPPSRCLVRAWHEPLVKDIWPLTLGLLAWTGVWHQLTPSTTLQVLPKASYVSGAAPGARAVKAEGIDIAPKLLSFFSIPKSRLSTSSNALQVMQIIGIHSV